MSSKRQIEEFQHTSADGQNFWLEKDVYESLRVYAAALGVSYAEILRRAAKAYVVALEQEVEIRVRVKEPSTPSASDPG